MVMLDTHKLFFFILITPEKEYNLMKVTQFTSEYSIRVKTEDQLTSFEI